MRYLQKYTYFEYPFGNQSVNFVVSDSYEELYEGDYTETDIFILDRVSKDLEVDEGSYAIDELPFSINHLACKNETDEQAMYFCLDAADIRVNRYCAVFFGEETTLTNMLFCGKINNKISGDDIIWAGVDYATAVNPKREYSLTAYSFDISILEECKHTDDIYNAKYESVFNIYERLETYGGWYNDDLSLTKLWFAEAYTTPANDLNWFCPIGNLYDILQVFLNLASQIILELTNTNITFNILESDLGFEVSPVTIVLTDEFPYPVESLGDSPAYKKKLKIAAEDGGDDWSSVMIHRKMIDPALGNSQVENWQKNQVEIEKNKSFKEIDNVAELLYRIARSFGCFMFLTPTETTTFNLEFISREGLVESEVTYIIGSEEAKFDTEPVNTKTEYYAYSTTYTMDGADRIKNDYNTNEPKEKSEKVKYFEEVTKETAKESGKELEKLLLSTGAIIHQLSSLTPEGAKRYEFYPLNTTAAESFSSWFMTTIRTFGTTGGSSGAKEYLHTGIYLKTTPPEAEQRTWLAARPTPITEVWRPAYRVFKNFDGLDKEFNSLSEYVSFISENDSYYYETQYELTLPFWNGFKKAGGTPSWKNIKLGSKIQITENVQRYDDETSIFITEAITRNYVVVGIEWTLSKPETKLKLQNLNRFAYGYYDGEAPAGIVESYEEEETFGGSEYVSYEIETDNVISEGDAVMLLDTGKIIRAISHSDYYGRTIGIAKQSGVAGEFIFVQRSGVVTCEYYNFTYAGDVVYARTAINVTPPYNVTQIPVATPSESENMLILLGFTDSSNSFRLNIREYIFEENLYGINLLGGY